MTRRVLWISTLAAVIGIVSAYVALALLRLIGLFTNLAFFGRWNTALVSPAGNRLGLWELLIPVAGGLIIGLMARFGSQRIRGHGIPEAIEAILIGGSKIEPRVAVLKPLASAICIGTGGPFGAEGPIIMTGGAFGSLIAQFFQLSSDERKTLLAAGAAGGMSATFAAPFAAVLLAIEVLLFEWKPRSLIPVALASLAAVGTRVYLLGAGPLFPVPPHPAFIGPAGLLGCVLAGIAAGALASVLTAAVYGSEDLFHKMRVHWMWWPAIGGVLIGTGGLIFPQALGVGYDMIGALLTGDVPRNIILGILLVKSIIWAGSLGSGTSGGVLAPLLMMGGALGGLESGFLPHEGVGFWPLVSMGAILGGAMRAPLTAVVFSLELTRDVNMLTPLLVAVIVSHCFTALTLRRSILTEKVARRGYHLSQEYSVDPLEVLSVREVMRTNIIAFPAEAMYADAARTLRPDQLRRLQLLYPVIDEERRLVGVIPRNRLVEITQRGAGPPQSLGDLAIRDPIVAYMDEPLRVVAARMAETGLTRFPVLENAPGRKLAGMVALHDLLRARTRALEQERRRERVLRIHLPFGSRRRSPESAAVSPADPGRAA